MKAAFVSYNSIGGLRAGWHKSTEGNDNEILVIPNSKGNQFATSTVGSVGNDIVTDEITKLWQQLDQVVNQVDKVVVYVGDNGSEVAIKLASKLPAEKVAYVLCSCNERSKRAMIKEAGHAEAQIIMCECRGIRTMGRLCGDFLSTGKLN